MNTNLILERIMSHYCDEFGNPKYGIEKIVFVKHNTAKVTLDTGRSFTVTVEDAN